MSAPTTEHTSNGAAHGLTEHSHIGGRTVPRKVESHLHPIGSLDLSDHPVPTGKEEVWRFTPLRRLRDLHADAAFGTSSIQVELPTVDGVSVAVVDGPQAAAVRGTSGYLPIDRTTSRIFTEAGEILLVDVPAGAEVADPIEVVLTGTGAERPQAGHVVVRFGENSRADVVLSHRGSATVAQLVEIVVGDGAKASVTSLQEWDADAVQLAHHHIQVGRDAAVKHAALTFGGDLVRVSVTVDFTAPGGDVELLGLYFADAGQHLEHRLFIDHDQPHCRSRVLYKGALQGKSARTVWIGDVLIRQNARGTDTYEMNRNLALTPGARADSVPNLEIETGEIIGAGHASATGRFDDEQLFYLLSRGISEDVAKRLVVRGFFHEVLQHLGIASVVERAGTTIERELAISGN